MKKSNLFTILFFICSTIFAQRDGGDISVSAIGGISKNGYNGQLHADYYFPYSNFILEGKLIYSNQDLPTNYDMDFKLQQFGFATLIGWSPEKHIKHPFFLDFLIGGYIGYDYGNKGNDLFSDFEIPFDLKKYNKINYGFITTVQAEINLSENISILSDFSQIYRFGSNIGNYTYYISGGIKIYVY